jgi:hypothetical protein
MPIIRRLRALIEKRGHDRRAAMQRRRLGERLLDAAEMEVPSSPQLRQELEGLRSRRA